MRNRGLFSLVTSCLVLSVTFFLLHNTIAGRGLENGMAAVPRAGSVNAAEPSIQKLAKLPLSFERHGLSEFVARGQGYNVDIRGARATIAFAASKTIVMEFVRGRQTAAIPENELPGKVNYLLGSDRRQWRLGLPTYERVLYRSLYKGIDVVYYGNQNQIEFDLLLQPRADLNSIRLRFSGAGKPRTDPSGSLTIGDLLLSVPKVTQGKKIIPARYKVLGNGEVAFELGDYDKRQALIIDPTLVYSTRLGGGNGGNQGNAIAVNASGNAYVAGETGAADFPTVNPAYSGYQANTDGFISKLNSTGTELIYSTYIGGSNFDKLQGIAADSTGAVWVVGYTFSSDFPLLTPYQSSLNGASDAVVIKLSPSGALVYSSFLGGAFSDVATSVAVDPFGNAYVAGSQSVTQGNTDAFVTKFTSGGSFLWSTFVGGTNFDSANGIAVDGFGNAYIAGVTFSNTIPSAPPGGAQPTNRGSGDAFVAKINFNASALIYFTFLGGSGWDSAQAIAVDPLTGITCVAGNTTSTDLSVSAGAVQSANAGATDGFVAKLNAAGSSFLYTTYLGANRSDNLLGVAIDPNGNAYVAGYSDSNTFPTTAAIQSSVQGNSTSLFRTSNTGANWTPFDTNLPGGGALGFSPDPVNAGTFVASTNTGTYRSTNNGSTWTQQSPVRFITLTRSPANPVIIYGLTGGHVYQSIDNGVTWIFKGPLPKCCLEGFIADPFNAAVAYVFNAFDTSLPGVQKTTDNGVTWSTTTNGLPPTPIVTTMVAGSDGSLYAGLSYAPGVSPGGLYKSTNQGSTWVPINSGLHSNFGVPPDGLAVAPTNPLLLFVTDYFTLFESTNGGAAWSTIGTLPGGTSALAVSSTSASTLFYAAYNSESPLWVSTNSGTTWNPSSGLGVADLNQVQSDPLNGEGAYALAPVPVLPIVAKIDAGGQNLLYSTYLGGYGAVYGISSNGTGDAFITGSSWEFPTTPSALQRNRSYYQNNLDGFVARISDATEPCSFSVGPSQSVELWFPRHVQYVVTAPTGCAWTASSDQSWATIASGGSGSGSGIVYALLSNNNTGTTRTATLTIAGHSVPLTQRSGGCGYNVFSPDSAVVPGSGGSFQVNLMAGAGCGWTLTNNYPGAVMVLSGSSGNGNGTVTMSVAPNPGPNTRTFVIGSPQGGSVTITQAGTTAPAVVATITSTPSGAAITTIGTGCIPGTYTTPANLTWNANTNCTVNFTSPQTIAGAPYTFYSASVNGGHGTTTNPLTVNSGSSAITINANFLAPCTYSLTPPEVTFGPQFGLGSFVVNTGSTCGWTAVPSAGWITILPSGSKGTGKINYVVAPNNTQLGRSGFIQVGGQQHNISQAGLSCSYSIGPTSASPGNAGGTLSVSVSAPSGCLWTAVRNVSWLTISSGGSGSGTGVVRLNVARNTGGSRSGTATIAGKTFSVTQGGASACGALDITSKTRLVTISPRYLYPSTYDYYWGLAVKNTSTTTALSAPIYLAVIGVSNNITLIATPTHEETTCFSPQPDYLFKLTGIGTLHPEPLRPGETVGIPIFLHTRNLGDVGFLRYTTKVLMGRPSQ